MVVTQGLATRSRYGVAMVWEVLEVRLRKGSLGKAGVHGKALLFQLAPTALFSAITSNSGTLQKPSVRE